MKKKAKRSKESRLFISAMIWGIAFTAFMLLAIGPKIIGDMSSGTLMEELRTSFVEWYSPYAFFLVYLLGYAIVWRKRLYGSLIIMGVSVFYVIMGGFDGPPIFAVPAFLVGVLYFFSWIYEQRKKGRKLIFSSWLQLQGD